jgi:type VI secretion system secreted protein VgrG
MNSRFLKVQIEGIKAETWLIKFDGFEAINRLFEFELILLVDRVGLVAEELVGRSITIRLGGRESSFQYYNGRIAEWHFGGKTLDGLQQYCVIVKPWLYFLGGEITRRSFCSMKKLRISEFLETLFSRYAFSDYRVWVSDKTNERVNYAVQYDESTQCFVLRLLNQAGLNYFFEHDEKRHIFVVGDREQILNRSKSTPVVLSDQSLYPGEEREIFCWQKSRCASVQHYAMAQYDFERADRVDFVASIFDKTAPRVNTSLEYFQFDEGGPGVLNQTLGETLNKYIDQLGMVFECVCWDGHFLGLKLCKKVRLGESRLQEIDDRFVHALWHHATDFSGRISGSFSKREENETEPMYRVRAVMSESNFFANQRGSIGLSKSDKCLNKNKKMTDISDEFFCDIFSNRSVFLLKPKQWGLNMGKVIDVEEPSVFTKQCGRIRVRFDWNDGGDLGDEIESDWIRFRQLWAGKTHGAQFIPQKGERVVVVFLNGEPSVSLVLGVLPQASHTRLFSGKNILKNGWKTRSINSPSLTNANTFALDDHPADPKMIWQAKRDMNIQVDNSANHVVKGKMNWMINEGDFIEEVVGQLTLRAKNQLSLVCGDSELIIKPNEITLRSPRIYFEKISPSS